MGIDPSIHSSTTTRLLRLSAKRYRPSPWGKLRATIKNARGKVVRLKLHRRVPKKCSVPRQLCLFCRRRIHRNDPRYKQKRCRECEASSIRLRPEATVENAPRVVAKTASTQSLGARPVRPTGPPTRSLRGFFRAVVAGVRWRRDPAVASPERISVRERKDQEPEAPS